MRLRDIRDTSVRGKRVLVRVDYNINVAGGRIRDLARIQSTVPTLRWLLAHGAGIVLVSHRGRPKGRDVRMTMRPMIRPLARAIGKKVTFFSQPIRSAALRQAIEQVRPGTLGLLENIRFDSGEERNSLVLARHLATLGDIFVNDAFADSHRGHASIVGVARLLPSFAGLLLQTEVKELTHLCGRVRRPYVAIIGGAKISTKLGVVKQLLRRTDYVLLGGALANTVLQAEGLAVGRSLTEPAMVKASAGLSVAQPRLKIPVDVIVSSGPGTIRACSVGQVGAKETIVDIGPDTVELFRRIIVKAKTIVWNGPMGRYEQPPYDRGTLAVARAIGRTPGRSIAGGGETLDAIHRSGQAPRFTFLSTGGGAMLEFLEGKILPGLRAVAQT
ncbi:MAG: phosphoglycerate kinase [Candidatus Kerfeldbacteria bacterium]|nr:phosphoglycerate kinase [Candidatus Kerfeldbacteria bacterium]